MASAAGCGMPISPPSTSSRQACGLSRERDVSAKRDTAAMLASASPRNPSVAIGPIRGFVLNRRPGLRRKLCCARLAPGVNEISGHFDVALETDMLAQGEGLVRIEIIGQNARSTRRHAKDFVVPLESRE